MQWHQHMSSEVLVAWGCRFFQWTSFQGKAKCCWWLRVWLQPRYHSKGVWMFGQDYCRWSLYRRIEQKLRSSWRMPVWPSRTCPLRQPKEFLKYGSNFPLWKDAWPLESKIRGTWPWWHPAHPVTAGGRLVGSLRAHAISQVRWRIYRAWKRMLFWS